MSENQPEVRIVLSMIVKNEAKVIRRCLDAAFPLVDAFYISDTGSTDGTVDLIRDLRKEHDKPGVVTRTEWKNFAHNRSLAAAGTLDWVLHAHPEWRLARTYMLLLDADMVIRAMPVWNKQGLTAPCYDLEQRDAVLQWFNTRLCRLDFKWEAVSVTHEYWKSTPDVPHERLSTLWINDIGDGGNHGDKLQRDEKLLREGLESDPDNVRYHFYLAETLMNLGKFEEAIEHYERRRTLGGWQEEVWYSLYKIGKANLRLEKRSEAIAAFLQAFNERPSRAEPLIALAQYFRGRSMNTLAMLFAERAKQIPLSTDGLFVETPAYTTAPLEELAISAYYTPEKAKGRDACEALLDRVATPHFHDHIARCASFYLKPIMPLCRRFGRFHVSKEIASADERFFGLEEPSTTTYLPSNPTIVNHKGKTFVNVRLVNYHHERGRVFASKDPDGVIRTRNVIQEWDPETGQAISEAETRFELPEGWDGATRVRGLEDQRWASCGDEIWMTATCFNVPGAGGMPRVVLAKVADDLQTIERITELKFKLSRQYEKNWLPWFRNGKLQLIYGYSPFLVLDVDKDTGECSIAHASTPPWATHRWRGSAAPIPLDGGADRWLIAIHETAWFEGEALQDQRTVYMHRFVELVGTEVTRKSRLFTFEHSGVEYAAGLLRHNNRIIVTHSVEESSAHWKELEFDTVERLLRGELPLL